MKAFVDKNTCIGCGLCEGICPRVFRMEDDGTASAIENELEDTLIECAREAETQCPVSAITVE